MRSVQQQSIPHAASFVGEALDYVYKAATAGGPLPSPPKHAAASPFLAQLRCLSVRTEEDRSEAFRELAESLGPPENWQRENFSSLLDVIQRTNHRLGGENWDLILGRAFDYIASHLPEEDSALARLLLSLPKAKSNLLKDRLLCERPEGLEDAVRTGGMVLKHCLNRQDANSESVRAFHAHWIEGRGWNKTRGSVQALLELNLSYPSMFPLPVSIESSLDSSDSTANLFFALIEQAASRGDPKALKRYLHCAFLEPRQVLLVTEKLLIFKQGASLAALLRRQTRLPVASDLVFAISQLVLKRFEWQLSEEDENQDHLAIRTALEHLLNMVRNTDGADSGEPSLKAKRILAELYWRTGQTKRLVRVYPALRERRSRDEIHLRAASYYLDADRPREAESALARVKSRSVERDVFFGSLLSRVYRRLGKNIDASNTLHKVRVGISELDQEDVVYTHSGFVVEYGLNRIICGEWRQFSQFMARERADSDDAPIVGLRMLHEIVRRNYQSLSLAARNALGIVNELASEKWFPDYEELVTPLIGGLLFSWATQGRLDLLEEWRKEVYVPRTLSARIRSSRDFYLAFAQCSRAAEQLTAGGTPPWECIQRMLETVHEPRQLGLSVHLLVAIRDRLSDWPLRGRTMERYALLHLTSIVEDRIERISKTSPDLDLSHVIERLKNATLDSITHILDDPLVKED